METTAYRLDGKKNKRACFTPCQYQWTLEWRTGEDTRSSFFVLLSYADVSNAFFASLVDITLARKARPAAIRYISRHFNSSNEEQWDIRFLEILWGIYRIGKPIELNTLSGKSASNTWQKRFLRLFFLNSSYRYSYSTMFRHTTIYQSSFHNSCDFWLIYSQTLFVILTHNIVCI